jgi:RNA recognition motif-containing protein
MKIFVGNLSKHATARQLADLFFPFGKVLGSTIASDNSTGRSLGYGYVEMERRSGSLAIQNLDRLLFMSFYMEVNEAL